MTAGREGHSLKVWPLTGFQGLGAQLHIHTLHVGNFSWIPEVFKLLPGKYRFARTDACVCFSVGLSQDFVAHNWTVGSPKCPLEERREAMERPHCAVTDQFRHIWEAIAQINQVPATDTRLWFLDVRSSGSASWLLQ